ncbi:MAG TPA: hypothetical protein VFH80_35840 [Solirubrobacteraceae bacterium]|nr:hypothetical protein [Solirubrobacteraceae bacterium]
MAPNETIPFTVLKPGESYSSNVTPRSRSSATVASMSSTVHPICVWSPEAFPLVANSAS